MSQSPHTAAPDTSGSPGLLGGALALGWFAIMSYGPLATWGAPQLLKQSPGFLVMLAAVAIFPALGLWMLVGAWRTAWTGNVRHDADADRLHAEIGDLRATVASLTTLVEAQVRNAAPAVSPERSGLDAAGAPYAQARLNVTSLTATLKIAPAPRSRKRRASGVAQTSTPAKPAAAESAAAKPVQAAPRRRAANALVAAVAPAAPEPPPITRTPSHADAPTPPPLVVATGGKRMKTSLDARIDETTAPRRVRRVARAAG